MPGEQARDHAGGADPGRHRRHGRGQLHRPPGRPRRRRRLAPRAGSATTPRRRRRFVTTEPIGHDGLDAAQQPPDGQADLRLHDDQLRPGDRTAISNGVLVANAPTRPTAEFAGPDNGRRPRGSRTWNWHSPEPIANYLVENSVGHYDNGYDDGVAADRRSDVLYYEFQASHGIAAGPQGRPTRRSWTAGRHHALPGARSTGRSRSTPTASSSALPSACFEEEMQTKIIVRRRRRSTPRHVQPREHAPVVGRQRLREPAPRSRSSRRARRTCRVLPGDGARRGQRGRRPGHAGRRRGVRGQPGQPASTRATTRRSTLLDRAPSNPTSSTLFAQLEHLHAARARPTSRCARSSARTTSTTRCKEIQHDFGGGSISETQMEDRVPQVHAEPDAGLPRRSSTSSSSSGGTRPTRPAAAATSRRSPARACAGGGFYDANGGCSKQLPPVSTLTVTGRKVGDWYGGTPRPTLVFAAHGRRHAAVQPRRRRLRQLHRPGHAVRRHAHGRLPLARRPGQPGGRPDGRRSRSTPPAR